MAESEGTGDDVGEWVAGALIEIEDAIEALERARIAIRRLAA